MIPSCPQCGALVSRAKAHTCKARSTNPNWGSTPEPLVEDPTLIRRRLDECRAQLDPAKRPVPAPAGDLPLYRTRPHV